MSGGLEANSAGSLGLSCRDMRQCHRQPPPRYCTASRTGPQNSATSASRRLSASSLMIVLLTCPILLLLVPNYVHSQDYNRQRETLNGDRPKLIPLVVADSGYSENSSVNILCTVSQGHHESLTFDWFKDGHLLSGSLATGSGSTDNKIDEFSASGQSSLVNGGNFVVGANSNSNGSGSGNGNNNGIISNTNQVPQIEKHQDHSLLRIARVQAQHSGRYTCSAKNQFGQDSSSVNLIVNVKLQWIKEPPKEIVVSLNQELKVDCLAQGEPKPSMRWEKLESASISSYSRRQQISAETQSSTSKLNQLVASSSNGYKLAQLGQALTSPPQNSLLVSSTRYLNIQRARESDSGVYECIASNSHDQDLRKLVHVQVRGK